MNRCTRSSGVARFLGVPAVCALVALLTSSLPAQSPAAQQKQEPAKQQAAPPAAVVKVTTRLVQVSVIVQDKHGDHVSDLTRDDFQVFDDGKPQEIRVFSVESSEPLKTNLPPLPPNTYTNRFQQRPGAPSSVTIVLLDGLNTAFLDQAYARKQVAKFLLQLKPEDRVALYALGRKLIVLHDFTTDSAALIRALAKYMGEKVPELEKHSAGSENVDLSALGDVFSSDNVLYRGFTIERKVDMTVSAFEMIAHHLAGLPGRKNLVWVSSSFPISFGYPDLETAATSPSADLLRLDPNARFFAQEAERAARALTDANVALYPVDARGLIAPDLGFQSIPRIGAGSRPIRAFGVPPRAYIDTMNVLADRTGGRAFYNTNDLKGAIRSAIEDSRVTYSLGFYPNLVKWDGKFRNLKVEVSRPHLHVRARKGYFALPDPHLEPSQKAGVIREAALSPLDGTGIPLTVHVDLPGVPGIHTLHAQVQFDARSIQLTPENGRWDGLVTIDFVQTDDRGEILTGTDHLLKMELLPETYERVLKEGYEFGKEIDVRANAFRLRVVVRDEATGAIGTVSIPVNQLFSAAN
jgi:VWFA-related protein